MNGLQLDTLAWLKLRNNVYIHAIVPFIKVGEQEQLLEGFQSWHSDLGERLISRKGCEEAFGESW